MDRPLCIIVGMGRGISYGVARRFQAQGFAIGMISRDPTVLRQIEQALADSRGVVADAADEQGLCSGIRRLGHPEVLVYNASAGHPGTPTSLNSDDAIADFRVNALGAMVAVREVAPRMQAAGRGTILLTGGGLALSPMAQMASLSIGKAALRSLALSLAEELEPAGIHVATVTVCGFVEPGTRFDPLKIADLYWSLHVEPKGQFQREVVYQ
jgi:short-subunit dehydrogenase